MTTYNVKIPVYDTIEVQVEAENHEEAEEKAIQKAMEEHPKVSWLVDEDSGVEVEVEE